MAEVVSSQEYETCNDIYNANYDKSPNEIALVINCWHTNHTLSQTRQLMRSHNLDPHEPMVFTFDAYLHAVRMVARYRFVLNLLHDGQPQCVMP